MHESGALLLDPQDLYRLDRGLYNQEASCSHGPSRQGGCWVPHLHVHADCLEPHLVSPPS